MKQCCTCKGTLPIDDFHNDRTKKDGKCAQCKNCKNKYRKIWNQNNPEKRKMHRKIHKKLRKYKLKRKDYNKMVEYQGGKCVICEKTCTKNPVLSIDHDHKTGKVRGLLCNACNSGIAFFKDDINLIERAIHYLQAHR